MKLTYKSYSINSFGFFISPWISASLLVALFFSAPAVNILEAILVFIILISKDLRIRLIEILRTPLALSALSFYGFVIIAATYSIGSSSEAWGMVIGWRKILILPIIFCVISSSDHKHLLLKTFLATSLISLIWSFSSHLFPEIFMYKTAPGIIVKNHATQGMFFGTAIFIALIFQDCNEISRKSRLLLFAFIALALYNIMTITYGRSGYLVTAMLIMIFTLQRIRGFGFLKQIIVVTIVSSMLLGMFMSSKVSRDRIQLGVSEFTQLNTQGDAGSMGVRHYWWKHSLNMIKQNPIFGIGTGAFGEGLKNEVKHLSGPIATKTNDPHNQYLKIAVEQGIVGLLVFFSIIFCAFMSKSISNPFRLVGLAVLMSWCATSFASSHFSTFHEGHFIWFWLGAMLAPEK